MYQGTLDYDLAMDMILPARDRSLQQIYHLANELVDDIGVRVASEALDISSDTMRRRLRGDLAWSFEELIDLARYEQHHHERRSVAKAITQSIAQQPPCEARPLQVPSNLRQLLRLVGRLTTEIAESLDDGRVDAAEAERLLGLLQQLDDVTAGLQVDLQALRDHHG